jgi:hypothetical protein
MSLLREVSWEARAELPIMTFSRVTRVTRVSSVSRISRVTRVTMVTRVNSVNVCVTRRGWEG